MAEASSRGPGGGRDVSVLFTFRLLGDEGVSTSDDGAGVASETRVLSMAGGQ